MDTNSRKYSTIMCDAPWQINQRGADRRYAAVPPGAWRCKRPGSFYGAALGRTATAGESGSPAPNTPPLERIKAMPVADLCEDNAHLYLWCPNGLIPEALEVIKAEPPAVPARLSAASKQFQVGTVRQPFDDSKLLFWFMAVFREIM